MSAQPASCLVVTETVDGVHHVRLVPGHPDFDLWNGQRWVQGDRLPTQAEIDKLITDGEILRQALATSGKVVFKQWFPKTDCEEVVRESYRIEAQAPRSAGREYTLANLFEQEDLDPDSPDLMTALTRPLDKKRCARLNDLAFPGKKMGAEQVCPIYNLAASWRLRARGYPLAVALTGSAEVLPDIDRLSKKISFSGPRARTEVAHNFPHVDADPDQFVQRYEQQQQTTGSELESEDKEPGAKRQRMTRLTSTGSVTPVTPIDRFQGLIHLADVSQDGPGFAFIPGSQDPEFWARLKITHGYQYMFRNRTKGPWRPMVKVDHKQDPANLSGLNYEQRRPPRKPKNASGEAKTGTPEPQPYGKLQKLGAMEAGDYFVWTEQFLHALVGSKPGKVGYLRLAQYQGYSKADLPNPSGYLSLHDYVADRVHSIESGLAPAHYPSGGQTHQHQPKRFDTLVNLVRSEHKKNGTPIIGPLDSSQVRLALLDPKQVFNYQPPAGVLTKPFYRQLVGLPYVAADGSDASVGTLACSS